MNCSDFRELRLEYYAKIENFPLGRLNHACWAFNDNALTWEKWATYVRLCVFFNERITRKL